MGSKGRSSKDVYIYSGEELSNLLEDIYLLTCCAVDSGLVLLASI